MCILTESLIGLQISPPPSSQTKIYVYVKKKRERERENVAGIRGKSEWKKEKARRAGKVKRDGNDSPQRGNAQAPHVPHAACGLQGSM